MTQAFLNTPRKTQRLMENPVKHLHGAFSQKKLMAQKSKEAKTFPKISISDIWQGNKYSSETHRMNFTGIKSEIKVCKRPQACFCENFWKFSKHLLLRASLDRCLGTSVLQQNHQESQQNHSITKVQVWHITKQKKCV